MTAQIFLWIGLGLLGGRSQTAPNPPTVRETMEQGLALLQSGKIEEATAVFESILASEPRHGPARLQLGQIAVARGDWEAARRHLEIAIESRPQRLYLAQQLLGTTCLALGETESARRAFERAMALAPNFVPPRLGLAAIAESGGDLWTALAMRREAIALGAGGSELYAALANTARRMGAFELARCAAERAIQAEPNDGAIVYLRAVILQEMGRVDDAVAACRRARELGFDEAPLHVTLGNLYHAKTMLTESIASFETALEKDPAAAESIAAFALSSLTTKDYQKLRALLELHVKAHPESLNTLYGLGAMYLREEALDPAEAIFTQLSSLAPRSSQALYNLAMIYARQGRDQEQRAALVRFRELKQEENEEWARQNQFHQKRLKLEAAREAFDHRTVVSLGAVLAQSGTQEPGDWVAFADSLLELGRPEEAMRASDRLLELSPYAPEALSLRVQAAEALSDEASAKLFRERLDAITSPCVPEAR